jgi:plastocyanin
MPLQRAGRHDVAPHTSTSPSAADAFVAARDAAIVELADLDLTGLRARWKAVTGRPAPTSFRSAFLRQALAYEIAVAGTGGLKASTRRQLKLLAEAAREGRFVEALQTVSVKPGTQLIRVWEGRTHRVDVAADGFVLAGKKHRSLSAVAKEITGTNWNGWSFFGVRRPKERNRNAAGPRRQRNEAEHG